MSKNKIFIIAIAVLALIAIGAGYWFYQLKRGAENAIDRAGNFTENLGKEASKGVLPSINTNPLENSPDTNPVSKTNPFSNIKINPFK